MIGAVILQVVLIALNAVFASAEIAVISMNETKLKKMAEDGNKKAIKLSKLTEQPARFLSTIQVAITMAGLLGSAFAAENFAGPVVDALVSLGIHAPEKVMRSVVVLLITVILAYFNLVFGELVPKRIAMKKTEAMALGMSGMLYAVSKAFAPLVFLLTVSTNGVLRLIGIDPEEQEEQVSEEEIRMLLTTGNEQGNIDAQETEMIQNVFEFDDISVLELCTHRLDVVYLSLEDDDAQWEETIHESRHTFFPVCGESIDDIRGVLNTKDYFRMRGKSREYILEHAVDQVDLVPETMKANVLFQNMQKSRNYFAAVIDEYGGISGIITLHDLMEALVGELYETEEAPMPLAVEKIGENTWKVRGYADLEDVSDALEVELPTDTYDTFSGFICGLIGKVPRNGEQFSCEYESLEIQVHTVENHRVMETTVTKREMTEEEEEE
ncbi:MAG: HlyC/CorC family transporter [Clostridiales bacterium]|uniref:HlyC/CorC family transporter n=1 Tax=Candidatus Pullilachnospira stercoravium TaxID=2840913 RepID=A0A9D1NTF8_9FIRM|nr:HlyC/CorC family transporter [Clostridiales bacterium]HIV11769.1 HlyC/CorC family transporter [Candidatus Pullilachnospira stercoravium]